MSYRDKYADEIEGLFYDLENRIMLDIVRRIKKEGQITSTADYQIGKLSELGYSSDEIESGLKKALNASYGDIWKLYDDVVEQEYTRNKTIYEQINGKFIPYEDNERLQQQIEAAKKQAGGDLENLTKTLGVVESVGGQMTFLPLTDYYRKALNNAVMDIASGAFDYNSVLQRTVNTLTRSGIRTIDYASGYSSRLPVAARRAVLTAVSQLAGEISEMNAEKLGTEYFEVTYHSGARPSHRKWQGRVYTKEELVRICGLGEKTGLKGINCYHDYYPFIPGVSERKYSDKWLREQEKLENKKKTFGGKKYTAYEARQKQRQMETSMRAQRQKVRCLEEGGADPEDIIIAKARYQGQLQEYRKFSNAMGLKAQTERVYIDGLGKVAPGSKAQNHYTSKMIRNATIDSKQYNRYKSVAGKSIGNLADYREMKYNKAEEFELLRNYVNSVKKGMVSPLSGFKNYKKIHDSLEKDVVGIDTTEGVKVTGKSKHFMERVIGTMRDPQTGKPRSGVSVEDISEALTNPVKVNKIKTGKSGRRSQKYVGENATVTINPDTGVLIQCNPTDGDLIRRLRSDKV